MDYIIMKFIMDKLKEGYTIKQIGYNTYTFTINSDVSLELFLSQPIYK